MKNRTNNLLWILLFTAVSSILFSCDEWFGGDDDDDDGKSENIGRDYATGLDTPWEMEWAPDGRLFVTQRPGVIATV